MRIDGAEVQPASDQEEYGPDGGEASEAARAALGGLEQSVDGLQESVVLTGLRPSDDAIEVPAYECSAPLHRLDLGAHHADTPVIERIAHDIDLLSVQDLA